MKFVDASTEAGLRQKVYCGGEHSWKYILETTGCGVAFIDYDNDGWLDIFVVNGWRLEGGGIQHSREQLEIHRKLVAEIGSRERPHLDMKIEKPY